MSNKRKRKRAIALGGGGPAAGLHLGALQCLEKHEIEFDVWALSCIGAWVGVYYHQCKGSNKADQTYDFFKEHIFRGTDSYARFPVNMAFGPDTAGTLAARAKFALDPHSYDKLFLPSEVTAAVQRSWDFWRSPDKWLSEIGRASCRERE